MCMVQPGSIKDSGIGRPNLGGVVPVGVSILGPGLPPLHTDKGPFGKVNLGKGGLPPFITGLPGR